MSTTVHMSPHEQYLLIVRENVVHHDFNVDGETWPLAVKACGTLLHESSIFPGWMKEDSPTYIDPRTRPLFHEIQSSMCTSPHLTSEDRVSRRLKEILSSVLVDCATLRKVVESERSSATPSPKESLLAVMTRTSMCFGRSDIFLQENVFIALPKHPSGNSSPLFNYMRNSLRVPMLISVGESLSSSTFSLPGQAHDSRTLADEDPSPANNAGMLAPDDGRKVPAEKRQSFIDEDHEELMSDKNLEGHSDSDDDSNTSETDEVSDGSPSGLFLTIPKRTVSEFLANCYKIQPEVESDEEEEVEKDQRNLAELDAHVLDHSHSKPLPEICSLPVVCMAEEASLPIVMSSILHQRRVWRISEPLIGIAFSKYDTTITFYFGWIDSDTLPGNILPQVHLGHIERFDNLDMAMPLSAVMVSQFLLSLDDHFSKLREAAHEGKASILRAIDQNSISRWRLDSSLPIEDTITVADLRERICLWLKGSSYKGDRLPDCMPPITRSAKSAAAVGVPSHTEPIAQSPIVAPQPSGALDQCPQDDSSGPGISSGDADITDSEAAPATLFKLASKAMSCSQFANGGGPEVCEKQVMAWLFDRKATLTTLLNDPHMRDEYQRFTQFMWPEAWTEFEHLPIVDAAIRPHAEELLRQVKLRQVSDERRYPAAKNIKDDILPIMKDNFSILLRACAHAKAKAASPYRVPEVEWRHDHDTLFLNFFVDASMKVNYLSPSLSGNTPAADSTADTYVHRALEQKLQMPRSYFVDIEDTLVLQQATLYLTDELREARRQDLQTWAPSPADFMGVWMQERADTRHMNARLDEWCKNTTDRNDCYERAGHAPVTGTCDALGTLRIPVPLNRAQLDDFRFARFPTTTQSYESKKSKQVLDDDTSQAAEESSGKQAEDSNDQVNASPLAQETITGTLDVMASSRCESRELHNMSAVRNVVAPDTVSSLSDTLKELHLKYKSGTQIESQRQHKVNILELPLLMIEYKTDTADEEKHKSPQGINQHRMYSSAAARFLEAIGITLHPIFSVVGDGPLAMLMCSSADEQGNIHIFERHTQSFDISTVIGAWHYATVLCRIAVWQSEELLRRFAPHESDLVEQLRLPIAQREERMRWTMAQQLNSLRNMGIKRSDGEPKRSRKTDDKADATN